MTNVDEPNGSLNELFSSCNIVDHEKLNHEAFRLSTFKTWPDSAPIRADELVKAGFYYLGEKYSVKCFSCGIIITDWDVGDRALLKHISKGDCDFVKMISSSIEKTTNDKTWESLNLFIEGERLKTFKGWPSPFVKPDDLSRAGFYYLKDLDKVRCFFCETIIHKWEVGDDPIMQHRHHAPQCPFIKGYNVGNIPLDADKNDNLDDTWGGNKAACYEYNMRTFSKAEKGYTKRNGLENQNPTYSTYEARLNSYINWPQSAPCKQSMAEAGFFYAGVSDHVRCFCCNGGLCNWEAQEDPWVEHSRWFGKCSFLILSKGHEFIATSQLQHPPILKEQTKPELLMESEPVKLALGIGIKPEIIQKVLTRHLKVSELPMDANTLIEACLVLETCFDMPTENLNCCASVEPTISSSKSIQQSVSESVKSPDFSMEDENTMLKDMRLCKICMDEEIGVVFLPCGHLISCFKCVSSLLECPLCRKKIQGTVKTFFS